MLGAANKIGGQVLESSLLLKDAFDFQRDFILKTKSCKVEYCGDSRMECFHFSYPADRREDGKANNKRSIRTQSLGGVSNMEGRGSGSDIMTQSDTDASISMESSTMTSSPSSKLSNHLRVFTFAELKTATRCFSRSLMLGEGVFGSVYKGWIKCIEESHKKIEVAIK